MSRKPSVVCRLAKPFRVAIMGTHVVDLKPGLVLLDNEAFEAAKALKLLDSKTKPRVHDVQPPPTPEQHGQLNEAKKPDEDRKSKED